MYKHNPLPQTGWEKYLDKRLNIKNYIFTKRKRSTIGLWPVSYYVLGTKLTLYKAILKPVGCRIVASEANIEILQIYSQKFPE